MLCYFNFRRGDELVLDKRGVEVRDPAQAYDEAHSLLCEMSGKRDETSPKWKGWAIEITDETGKILYTLNVDKRAD